MKGEEIKAEEVETTHHVAGAENTERVEVENDEIDEKTAAGNRMELKSNLIEYISLHWDEIFLNPISEPIMGAEFVTLEFLASLLPSISFSSPSTDPWILLNGAYRNLKWDEEETLIGIWKMLRSGEINLPTALSYSDVMYLKAMNVPIDWIPGNFVFAAADTRVKHLQPFHCLGCGMLVIRGTPCRGVYHSGNYKAGYEHGWSCCGAKCKKDIGCTRKNGVHKN